MSAPIADSLAAASAVRTAAEALQGRDAWIVGGAVRDAALGRDVVDVDLAVARDARGRGARDREGRRRARVQLSEEFGTWRALAAGAGTSTSPGFAAAPSRPTSRCATSRSTRSRFPWTTGRGAGRSDRRARRPRARLLRAVSERSFADDPLRVLRAARLAAELELELDPGTVELARAAAGRAGEPAGERQLAELRLLIAGADPLRGLELLDELGRDGRASCPSSRRCAGSSRTPTTTSTSTATRIEVLRQLLEVEADLDRYAGDRAQEVADAPRRAARRRAHPRRRAALRRRLPRPRQARDARARTAATSPSSATTARAPRSSASLCERLQGQPPPRRVTSRA